MSTAAAGEKDSFAVAATALAAVEDELERSAVGDDSAEDEEEWWKAEGMPWNHKPGRSDWLPRHLLVGHAPAAWLAARP